MGVVFRPTSDKEAKELTSLVFVALAQNELLDDVTITEHPTLFVQWTENWVGKAGTIVQDEGELYRSIHDVTNVGQNTKPSMTPAMWTHIGNPAEEYPEWEQPLGSHDTYPIGAKCTRNGEHYINEYDNNPYPPEVYGWRKVD